MKSKFFFYLVKKERIFITVMIAVLCYPLFFFKLSLTIDINFFFQKIWLVFLLIRKNISWKKLVQIYSKPAIKTMEKDAKYV